MHGDARENVATARFWLGASVIDYRDLRPRPTSPECNLHSLRFAPLHTDRLLDRDMMGGLIPVTESRIFAAAE